jgi:hypothetical protein
MEAEALKVGGMASRAQGLWGEAELQLLTAGLLAADCQDRRLEAQIARELGETYRAAGRLAECRATWTQSLAIFRQIGAEKEAREVESNLATLRVAR